MTILRTLSNVQINKRLSRYKNYGGCISRNQIAGKSYSKVWVVNMQSSTQGDGTHWCMIYPLKDSLLWFDSFGMIPPTDVSDWMKRSGLKCVYSNVQLQALTASSCGYWCEYVIQQLEKGRPILDILYSFTNNPAKNEVELAKDFA
jgi:hypothetical protein